MIRPEALAKNEPLIWSPGTGTDVWEMFVAARSGDVESVERLLAKDPSLVRATYEYRSALSLAVQENQLSVAALLLERGADPVNSGTDDSLLTIARDRGYAQMQELLERNIAGGDGAPDGSSIAAAIRDRNLSKVRLLLDASPDLVHARDERTNQPVHWAVMTRQLDMVDELLARGADIEAQRADGARPIQLTNGDYLYRGWRDVPKDTGTTPEAVLAHLRSRGASCDICTASYIGDLKRVRQLLDEEPSLANRNSDYVTYYACSGTPLRNAASAGHMEIARLLLERGADPNLPEEGIAPYGHALYAAVYHRHHEIARLLLERGASPNPPVESSADCLSIALRNGDEEMIDLLASYGAARSLEMMAYYDDVRTAAAVLAANPELADDPVAFGIAAEQGHASFVQLMLRYRPDLAQRVAVGGKTPELTELLFRHGMDANLPNWLLVTPLHRFAAKGDMTNASIFIDHGADLHSRDEELRSTPLGYAAKAGEAGMVEFLLQRGAKPTLPDDPPWGTPLLWATRGGHEDVVRLLKRYE